MAGKTSAKIATGNGQWWIYCLLLTTYCALSFGCAQVVTPDGGPKDSTPPRVVHYTPDSAATNFHGKKIVITFDEYIALNDLNKQLIISPAVKHKPEVTIRKKDLIIEFKDSLDANTTYSISFGKAIRDITENNSLNNFRFVFSTGSFIDSLKCGGTVVNAQTLRGEKNVLVMLYRNTGDSVPYKEKPYYYTRTDDNGNFLLTNLAAAKYKVFALDDQGEDYLYNTPEERIAFSDSLIMLSSDVDSLRMLMFREKPTKQRLAKVIQSGPGRIQLVYHLPIGDPSVSSSPALPVSMTPAIEYNDSRDTINIWLPKVETDSVTFIVKSGSVVLDTIPIALQKTGTKKPRAGTTDPRALVLTNNGSSGKLLPGNQFTFYSSNPIQTLDTSRIIFRMGADTIAKKVQVSASRRQVKFAVPFPEDSSFSVFIPPGAIIDIYGQKNDTLKAGFSVQALRMFGNLSVKMPNLEAGRYLVEVVDEKDRVVRDTLINGPATIEFGTMNAGNYRIRLIRDANGDAQWTPGNYPQKIQPERVTYYAVTVRVRAGWDMDIEWILQ